MAVGVPRQWNVGDLLTAALMNAVSSILNWLLAPDSARVQQNSAQSIPNATYTAVTFDTAILNTAGMWNSGSNTRLTAQTAGTYRIGGAVVFPSTPTGFRAVSIYVNGSSIINTIIPAVSGAGTAVPIPAFETHLNVGDYVQIFAYQNSGGALSLLTTPMTTVSATWISNN